MAGREIPVLTRVPPLGSSALQLPHILLVILNNFSIEFVVVFWIFLSEI